MVDTVILKLDNLRSYPQLMHVLNRKKSYGVSGQTKYVPNPVFTPVEVIMAGKADGSQSEVQKYDYITFMPSHSSKLTVYVNHTDNYARFNVSLPKLMYGHNVRHLYNELPPPRISDAVTHGWNAFLDAINVLFYQVLERTPPWSDIKIERLDLCMNWLALDQEHAKNTLQGMMTNRKAYQRINAPVYAQYQTTVFHKTDRYSFKIYHKGPEFLKHDFKRIYKNSPDVANRLLDIANKTLRFEVSFRKPFMAYLFHRASLVPFLIPVVNEPDLLTASKFILNSLLEPLPSGYSLAQAMNMVGLDHSSYSAKKVAKGIRKLVNRSPEFSFSSYTRFNPFGIAEQQINFDYYVFNLLAQRFQTFIDDMTVGHEILPKDTPQKIRKYAAMSSRFQDYELVNFGMYKANSISQLRSGLKKWLKKSLKTSNYNMIEFNEQFLF